MRTTNQIRSLFLNFFSKHHHTIVPSSSLIPHNDPTLMFTTAGMVQFKNVFTGNEKLAFSRAASSQKCVRAGGKHNDLDNVGYTARHHTFFEMLGNFSFGDYFKDRAIELAWTFLTSELGLSRDRLYITVYHDDDEACELWRKITSFPSDKIIRIATSDNFWSMGDTGPCGPCSEIFYDHGDHVFGGLPGTQDADGDRFMEIWNLVFMQYEQLADGKRINLPNPCIDTGMGLERVAAVVQGKHDNYDTDIFYNIITMSEELSGVKATDEHKSSHKVIADHLRSSAFLIADGVMPSNEGRGYVLRRIMRRAMRHVQQLGCEKPLLHKLTPVLIREMGEQYPELIKAQNLITETLHNEEDRFRVTLSKGLKILDIETRNLAAGETLSGDIAFKLYDTYGFPLDLTKDILRKKSIAVDEQSFDQAMSKQREQARASWVGSGEKAVADLWFDIYNQYGATEFLGYELTKATAKVIALVQNDQFINRCDKPGAEVLVILNQTPFYGESGGQLGDCGMLIGPNGLKLQIRDTKKYLRSLHVHVAVLESGVISVGDVIDASVDEEYRNKLRANHSATHLLHAVVKQVLGDHVIQKGSLVADERLRFDISHNKALTQEEILSIEYKVNELIRHNSEVTTTIMSLDEASQAGAMALFGEKYDSEVRVVSMGKGKHDIISMELCGGTHVKRTGDIGLFKIISEGAIAAGIRRIEAVTGDAAIKAVQEGDQIINKLSNLLMASPGELYARSANLMDEKKKLEKKLVEVQKRALLNEIEASPDKEQINGINLVSKVINDLPAKELRDIVETIKNRIGSGVVIIQSITDNKVALSVGVTDNIRPKISAVELVKESALILGGSGGGGKDDIAQGGGPDISKVKMVVEAVKQKLNGVTI